MDSWIYVLICSPACIITSFFNVLFIFCLMRPAPGVTLRNPLRFLFIFVIYNSSFLQMITASTIVMVFYESPFWLVTIARALVYLSFCGNFSCNAWISIFYYFSIVPQHHAFLKWIKRNLRRILYIGFLLNQIVLFSAVSLGAGMYILMQTNSTALQPNTTSSTGMTEDEFLFHVANFLYLLYCTCPMITLLVSWGKTFVFLRGHMNKMGKNSESFSQPQQKSQMRVTVTGMVQAVLFLPSTLWTIACAAFYLSGIFDIVDPDRHITVTFCSMSNFGNVLCFGFSQSVFRNGVESMVHRIKTAFT